MKAVIAASFIGASLALATMSGSPARAADDFSFSFDTGGVRFAYQDGYWDREHQWHKWSNAREREEFHHRFGDRYNAAVHTRIKNEGWRDEERREEKREERREEQRPHD